VLGDREGEVSGCCIGGISCAVCLGLVSNVRFQLAGGAAVQ